MESRIRNIAMLVNPTRENAKALAIAREIEILLNEKAIDHRLFDTTWPGDLNEFSEAWIIGGDGTVNWFVNAYPDSEMPLAVFPGGTGNDFQWVLYGEADTAQLVNLVLQARLKKVDAGLCNGKLFMNGVGIGFDGAIVKDLIGKKKLAGKASYLLSILKHVVGYHEKPCMIEVNGQVIQQDCFMISAANAKRYGGGFLVTPKASVNDGLLDLLIVGKISPLKRMRYLPVIEKGAHLELPFIRYEQAPATKITSPQKLHAHLDGEYLFASEFEISLLPGRFTFLY
jgi:YegS/Rv2252/BmrU family lipid kinase